MNFQKSKASFLSADGASQIACYFYEPPAEPIGVLQISHGMCEYMERYEEFADFLCGKGFAVCGHDHLGHGASAQNPDGLGYFAKKDGAAFLPEDVRGACEDKLNPIPPYCFSPLLETIRGTVGGLFIGDAGIGPDPRPYPIFYAGRNNRLMSPRELLIGGQPGILDFASFRRNKGLFISIVNLQILQPVRHKLFQPIRRFFNVFLGYLIVKGLPGTPPAYGLGVGAAFPGLIIPVP